MDNNNTSPSADLSIDPTLLAPQGTAPSTTANSSHLIDITPGANQTDQITSPAPMVSSVAPVMTTPLPEPKVLDITPVTVPENPAVPVLETQMESPLLTNLVPPLTETSKPLTEIVVPAITPSPVSATTPVATPAAETIATPAVAPLAAPQAPVVSATPITPSTSPLAEDPNLVQTIS